MSRFVLPPVGEPSVVRFPPVGRRILDNGLRVWVLEQSAVPAATVACVVEAGTAVDPGDRPGLASLVTALLTEGAGRYDAIALSDALARIGGQLEVEVGTDVATVYLTVLSRYFAAGLELLADVVRRPRFAPADFERARDLRISRLKQVARTPAAAADRALLTAVYGDHPYGHGSLGTTRAIEQITPDDVRTCWEEHWRPSTASILVAGDVSERDAHAAVRRAFADWTAPPRAVAVVPPPVFRAAPEVLAVHRPGAAQSEVRLGQLGPARRTADYHALVTLNAILGGQFTSRINRNLREHRAITYGARSSFEMRRVAGLFSCDASVQTDATATALAEMTRETRDIRIPDAISPAELDHAKDSLTRGYVRHFETAAQLARSLAQIVTYDLDDDTFDRFVPEVEHLVSADITRVADAVLRPDDCAYVVVGDLEQVGSQLELLRRPVRETTPEF